MQGTIKMDSRLRGNDGNKDGTRNAYAAAAPADLSNIEK
jgi:hypothetical protein